MNRERDSEVVHELVTSKYKIAERNRLAKYRFLSNENVTNLPSKHRGSEPSLAQTEKPDIKPVDLSVPGTPVSSRYLDSLGKFRKNQDEIETDSEDEDNGQRSNFNSLLQQGLKQFTSDMEKLQQETKSHDKLDSKENESASLTNGSKKPKKEPAISRIEKYFQESARRGSLTRDFSEVVETFDPKILADTNTSKPGTPISSKFVKPEKISVKKLEPFTDNMKKIEAIKTDIPPEKPKRANPVPLALTNTQPELIVIPATPIPVDPIEFPPMLLSSSEAKESKTLVVVEKKQVGENFETVDQETEKNEKPDITQSNYATVDTSARSSKEQSDSQQTDLNKPTRKLSVPGTPIDSRKLYNADTNQDDSDLNSDIEVIDSSEIKELAKDLINEIETMVEKADADEKMEKKTEQLISQEDNSKVKNYFEESEKERSYQRTFSEIENFNEPDMEVKEKVEKYFKESDEKKSFTRGFSEAVHYIEPVNIEALFKPGTPVSSTFVEKIKIVDEIEEDREIDPLVQQGIKAFRSAHDALHQPPEFKVEKYFEESAARHTLKRDFSEVIGFIGDDPHPKQENPEIKKFFEQSEQQKSFHRQFSDAVQTLPPRIKDILPDEKQNLHVHRSSFASVFSAPDTTGVNSDSPSIARKHGKKYGIDKYFAASLYRTAYHRSKNQRRGSEPDHRFAILEDEYVFGENDVLRSQVFQDDDQTPIHLVPKKGSDTDDDRDQQNVQFWRDYLKPYNLNLPTDIVMRDELMDKYAKYTLE